MNLTPYFIPDGSYTHTEEVKRSQFIAYIEHTPTLSDAKTFVNYIKDKHPDASHNCWAHIAGHPKDSQCYGFSDDGEPSGAAGRPIFNALLGSELGEITIVITRYFGGTKLGVGGMQRAYGGTARAALKLVKKVSKSILTRLQISFSYELQGRVDNLLKAYEVQVEATQYDEHVTMEIGVDNRQSDTFKNKLTDLSAGRAVIKEIKN